MSKLLINEYLKQLDILNKVSGSKRETIIREAFKDLLKSWGRQQNLVFLPEFPHKTLTKSNVVLDGALLHELRMPLGYWEAKDEKDDLDEEIEKKFRKGYPQDNIIFSDDKTVVLIQNKEEVIRVQVEDTAKLAQLLKLFFSYERAEIAGFRNAVEQFKTDLPAVLAALREMIEREHNANKKFRAAEQKFLAHAQEAINPSLADADVREMLIQHILTEEIFATVFKDSDFHRANNVAKELYALESEFFTGNIKRQTLKGLEPYYAAINAAAAQIQSHSEKQTFLKVIYENFYKVYNVKAADRLGVVYTPNEIVRFMIDGADWLCETHFGKNLVDKDVEILDPATGTGTFICELLEHFRGQPAKLKHKYLNELHANEVAILPYYVANLNIEATYAAITGDYLEFPNLCFVDTLDNVGLHTSAVGTNADLFGSVSEENVARIKRQNSKKISVVIGNPPYNANQANENDNNKNREYPAIDKRIKATYIAESTAQKTKLYDMYARFFRWASDRLSENGVLALITNRSFIESRTFDGFRKVVAQEFSDIYVVDLGGDVRANPKLSGTKHNVFGIQTGVAISFMVKRARAASAPSPAARERVGVRALNGGVARVYYNRRPELETAEEKLTFLANNAARSLRFDEVQPDSSANWLGSDDFDHMLPFADKDVKAGKSTRGAIFRQFSWGNSSNRDEWVYDIDTTTLHSKAAYFSQTYNELRKSNDQSFPDTIKWSESLKANFRQGRQSHFKANLIVKAHWRPFCTSFLYTEKIFNDRLTEQHVSAFGSKFDRNNEVLMICGHPQIPFAVHAIDGLPDAGYASRATQMFPRWSYLDDGSANDNITDWGLKQFKAHYAADSVSQPPSPQPSPALREREPEAASSRGKTKASGKAKPITKEAIFHYCYAVLHDPIYREKYALNLKRDFPRIPFYTDFWQWAAWGEALMNLHIGYEAVAPFALTRADVIDAKAQAASLAPKAMLRADTSTGSITLDSETTLTGVPPTAWTYKLGNRSALEWILDQYKEKKPKDPTIREKFDTYRFANYKEKVIDLLKRVTTVSVETVAMTEAMKTAKR
jgi:predicted helicase